MDYTGVNPDNEDDYQRMEDDNAAPDMQSESEVDKEVEDPLTLATEDLLGRVVNAVEDMKRHPGVNTTGSSVHEELASIVRPVLEVAAHTGPSVARTYGDEASSDSVYERIVSDLVLPFMLEFCQSDTSPAKRVAALSFLAHFFKECQSAGSWLDKTTNGVNSGPYGAGGSSGGGYPNTPAIRAQQKRRWQKKQQRQGELLRYWIQASIFCMVPGVFTDDQKEDTVASRGILAASASLKPSLNYIAQKIQDADDRGAAKLYGPVMKMMESVLRKLFQTNAGEGLRSSCVKFLEIVVLCCSRKSASQHQQQQRRRAQNSNDFSLDDLPEGHPVITREALESISDNAFSVLRGFVLMGGQVKIDANLQAVGAEHDGSPSSQVVSILRPASLAFLEIEQTLQGDVRLDRSNHELDFELSQKSFALTINAVSVLASNRPTFFPESSAVLARRVLDPPTQSSVLTKSACMVVASQLRASCLTLLRNALSVTTNSIEDLVKALTECNMKIQADKALAMAKQTAALKTAGRAARNRAAMFYEWDASDTSKRKRQRETDDALAKIRAAKLARGLGHGIQLPTSMTDAVELILLNLTHLPSSKPASVTKQRKRPITFDYVVDAVMTNGTSLSQDEGQWYDRDGGNCWHFDMTHESKYQFDAKMIDVAETKDEADDKTNAELGRVFRNQCQVATSQAFGRIWKSTHSASHKGITEFGCQVMAKLAWTLRGVQASDDLKASQEIASESVTRVAPRLRDSGKERTQKLNKFVQDYPLVSACLAVDVTPRSGASTTLSTLTPSAPLPLANKVLNEAFLESCVFDEDEDTRDGSQYSDSVDIYVASVVRANERANDKPNDAERKRVATVGTTSLTKELSTLPYIPEQSLELGSLMCDIEEITKKAAEAARKTAVPQQTIAASAAIHAAKVAAEKRATAALVALRDVAFQRSNPETRRGAINCAVSIAASQIPASSSIEDKALKLVMNVLFPKSQVHSDMVLEAASQVLDRAALFAIENHDAVEEANKKAVEEQTKQGNTGPVVTEAEKAATDKVKKAALLFMALCVRRPELIKTLMTACSRPKANILAKAVRDNMPKLARAAATKHGAATIALKVAEMAEDTEASMLLAFLDSLIGDKTAPSEELIEVCHKIQETKVSADGKKDPRFIIPVVSGMKRVELIKKLPEFVATEDNKIFMAALVHMGSRVARHALVYREEPDEENPVLTGMTLCEQLVFLHKMDFLSHNIPQKRYLDAIRLCLDDDEVFTDTIVREALDYMSGTFLTQTDVQLPLAYMRTIILTCSKHESLHNWICHILLPRLIDGKVYTDRRQWEGWMRCARMLENTGVNGVREAIDKLPPEQLELYRTKYPQK